MRTLIEPSHANDIIDCLRIGVLSAIMMAAQACHSSAHRAQSENADWPRQGTLNVVNPSTPNYSSQMTAEAKDSRLVLNLIRELEGRPGLDSYLLPGRSTAAIDADFDHLGDRALDSLVAVLKSPSEVDRYNAAYELGRMRLRGAVTPLLDLLKKTSTNANSMEHIRSIDRFAG